VEDSSPADTPESHTAADKRRKPPLKLEDVGSNKKPKRMYPRVHDKRGKADL
jgi:hypothetical protein